MKLEPECQTGCQRESQQGGGADVLFLCESVGHARTSHKTDGLGQPEIEFAAAVDGKRERLPPATFDSRFFHCEYHGELEEHQKKRADSRTYDNNVYYGSP